MITKSIPSINRQNLVVLLSLGLLILYPKHSLSQVSTVNSDYLDWFDKIIGIENTGLYSGIEYVPVYRVVNDKHQYFFSQDFINGTISFDDQLYPNVNLKYDIYQDILLLEIQQGLGKGIIQTIKSRLDFFLINERKFVNLSFSNDDVKLNGFYEVLDTFNTFVLYKKHILRSAKISNNGIFNYEFRKGKDEYYLKFKNQYYEIKSVRDLIEIFPQFRKQINKYYDRNQFRKDKDSSLILLTNRIYQLYLNT